MRISESVTFSRSEVTGAIGDSITVLPLIVAVALLTDLHLAVLLLWFGVFQIIWGLYYGAPISVEPMKALVAILLAGSLTHGEFLIAGLLVSVLLLLLGITRSLSRLAPYIDDSVVYGIQFGVALVLIEAGLGFGIESPALAGLGVIIAGTTIALGYWNESALLVLGAGGIVAITLNGFPTPAVPPVPEPYLPTMTDLTGATVEATVAQLAMTVGNAALATAVLMKTYFDRSVTPDQLSGTMGVMNLVAIPGGAMPMCHGSGGVAGKFAFGARTAGANVILGVGYGLLAIIGVGIVAAFPMAVLGVVLVLVAGQLAQTSLRDASRWELVVLIGVIGLVINLGVAFIGGILLVWLIERIELR